MMQVYHDFGRMRDFGHMADSGRKMRLRSYARLQSEDMTLIVYPDFGRHHNSDLISRLRSRITALADERAACLTTLAVKEFA
jgi:hypothetical protein